MLIWFRRLTLALCALAFAGAAAAQSGIQPPDSTADTVKDLQGQILANPELAGRVQSLRDDPQVRDILADPAVADALKRGDFGALLANPKIQQLAADPNVQGLTRQIAPPTSASR